MFNIIYSTDEDRQRLQYLQNVLPWIKDKKEYDDTLKEIDEIRSRQKPLHECNLQECIELKTAVHSKFERLQKTGKFGHAINFKNMMIQIENRMATIHLETGMKEAERRRLAKESVISEDKSKNSSEKSDTEKSSSNKGSSRWTTGIGNLD